MEWSAMDAKVVITSSSSLLSSQTDATSTNNNIPLHLPKIEFVLIKNESTA
jgi:hypothetical protein